MGAGASKKASPELAELVAAADTDKDGIISVDGAHVRTLEGHTDFVRSVCVVYSVTCFTDAARKQPGHGCSLRYLAVVHTLYGCSLQNMATAFITYRGYSRVIFGCSLSNTHIRLQPLALCVAALAARLHSLCRAQ